MDTLWGVLPTELPLAVRYFVVFMLVAHFVAIMIWLLLFTRELGGKPKFKPL